MEIGRWIIGAGLLLVVVGAVLQFAPWLVSWFGRLPGDVRIEGERTRVFLPITSMILVSIVATIIINLLLRR